MKITLVLFCLALISIVQAISHARISKPKLNLELSRNVKILETHKRKMPEERRKLSLFPKSNKKFIVSPVVQNKLEPTPKPFILISKKPLMKKIVVQHKRMDKMKIEPEQETKRSPIMKTKLLKENNLVIFQKGEPNLVSEEISIEIIEEVESAEGYKIGNDNLEGKDIPQEREKEPEKQTAATYIANKDPLKEKNDTSTPYVNSEESSEKKGEERLSDTSDVPKNSDEDEIADLTEFIFLNPNNPTESEKASSEETEEFITTETPVEPSILRMERSINVIEEENLGSTVSGYKYTWRDTKLNNDLVFKNINT